MSELLRCLKREANSAELVPTPCSRCASYNLKDREQKRCINNHIKFLKTPWTAGRPWNFRRRKLARKVLNSKWKNGTTKKHHQNVPQICLSLIQMSKGYVPALQNVSRPVSSRNQNNFSTFPIYRHRHAKSSCAYSEERTARGVVEKVGEGSPHKRPPLPKFCTFPRLACCPVPLW